jgi:hypothetical protein
MPIMSTIAAELLAPLSFAMNPCFPQIDCTFNTTEQPDTSTLPEGCYHSPRRRMLQAWR